MQICPLEGLVTVAVLKEQFSYFSIGRIHLILETLIFMSALFGSNLNEFLAIKNP